MIESCKYCLKQTYRCPRCEGPVLVRTITEQVPVLGFVSSSVYLCLTPECVNYGHFRIQTENSVVTVVCGECQARNENMRKFQTDLESTFKRSL